MVHHGAALVQQILIPGAALPSHVPDSSPRDRASWTFLHRLRPGSRKDDDQ
jgi:hypothetical protein